MNTLAFAIAALISVNSQAASTRVKVPIYFFEALAPRDTTSSERFQKEYEDAINTAKALTSDRLSKCGFELTAKTVFYGATDALEAHERGQAAQKDGAWLIVGPRRSNHYVLLAKGAATTPTVSTMASSQEIEALGPLHLSIAPTNRDMAKVAAAEVRRKLRKGTASTYASVVSEDCISCIDFSEQFNNHAKGLGLKQLGEFKVKGESPDLTDVTKSVAKEVLLKVGDRPSKVQAGIAS